MMMTTMKIMMLMLYLSVVARVDGRASHVASSLS